MKETSADSIFYSNSGERLIRYYCQLIDELQDKLNPSDRYKLDQKNLRQSIRRIESSTP